MFIRKTTKKHKGKTYTNYLLVESVHTEKGSRQRIICSLGSLAPGPPEQWRALARNIEASLRGQASLIETEDPQVESIVERVHRRGKLARRKPTEVISVDAEQITIEEPQEAGPVHVGHQMWRQLGLDEILIRAGLSDQSRTLCEVMTLNRLVLPASEYAPIESIPLCGTALGDILRTDLSMLRKNALYRSLDQLHLNREQIEKELAKREKELFDPPLRDTNYLLTSASFVEGALVNRQRRRGTSHGRGSDCERVLVGLVLNCDGFAKTHEVFVSNPMDHNAVADMIENLEQRIGKEEASTVVVNSGMGHDENLEQIKKRGYHYIVAGRREEMNLRSYEFEKQENWGEVVRMPSPRKPSQEKLQVEFKRFHRGDEVFVLCGKKEGEGKGQAVRQSHEKKLLKDLEALRARIAKGRLKDPEKIQRGIGRLKERYPAVARYYQIAFDVQQYNLTWQRVSENQAGAENLDDTYVLKTDRQDLSADDILRIYVLLRRVETAFSELRSPFMARPISHRFFNRARAHIFLSVLAYHLQVAIEKRFSDRGVHTSWWTLRQQLSTHQVVTVVMPTTNGLTLKIRKATTPGPTHRQIYETLRIPMQVMKPVKTWQPAET